MGLVKNFLLGQASNYSIQARWCPSPAAQLGHNINLSEEVGLLTLQCLRFVQKNITIGFNQTLRAATLGPGRHCLAPWPTCAATVEVRPTHRPRTFLCRLAARWRSAPSATAPSSCASTVVEDSTSPPRPMRPLRHCLWSPQPCASMAPLPVPYTAAAARLLHSCRCSPEKKHPTSRSMFRILCVKLSIFIVPYSNIPYLLFQQLRMRNVEPDPLKCWTWCVEMLTRVCLNVERVLYVS